MKKLFCGGVLLIFCITAAFRGLALDQSPERFEYATIRWAGRENTHVIRPDGKVEFVGSQLQAIKKPDRADERSFCMNRVMNALAKEGYEFAGMTPDEIVMKRPAQKSGTP